GSVLPAPTPPLGTPRGTTSDTSTSRSAESMPSRRSGTTSVPPARNTVSPAPSSSARLDGRRSSTRLLAPCSPERAEHLLARDRQLVHVGPGCVANRVRDRRRDRDDRRLADPLRAEVRQVLVRDVHE